MTDPRRPAVVLVGPPGAGKSTIGRKLAKELGVELFDTDAGIEADTGRTIPEIFATDGEPEFRRIEERVVKHAVQTHPGVVSLGGGAVLSAGTRELLRGRTVVYLEISVAEGLRRTGNSTNRPLLAVGDPDAKYKELMRIRRPLYREVASVRVRTDGRSPGRVVRSILTKLGIEPRPEAETTPNSGSSGRRPSRRRRGRGEAATTPKTPEAGDTATEGAASSRRRRPRRGGRNRSAAAGTPVNGTPGTTAPAGGDATTARPDRGDTGGRPRRSRGGRGRGGDRAAAVATTTGGDAPPAAAAAAVDNSAPDRIAVSGNRSRRRSASRPAGAPTARGAAPSGGGDVVGAHGRSAPRTETPAAALGESVSRAEHQVSSTSAGPSTAAAPAAGRAGASTPGRSRRARARRARTRTASAPPESETRTND